jgi:hypothetical protein
MRNFEIGPNNSRIGIEIIKLPATAHRKASYHCISPKVIPQGKATLSSPIGVMANKKVIQRGS